MKYSGLIILALIAACTRGEMHAQPGHQAHPAQTASQHNPAAINQKS